MLNREIKFRLWDSKKKKMINNLLCFYPPTKKHPRMGISWVTAFNPVEVDMDRNNHPGYIWGFAEGEILMQYTGLKDKKGKEIYEGDIVKWNKKTWEIKWNKLNCQYYLQDRTTSLPMGEWLFCRERMSKYSEVIGNIYGGLYVRTMAKTRL